MQLHFVHHLHPNIGHYDEPRAIEELKPFLIARGVPGAEEIPDRITYNPLIKILLYIYQEFTKNQRWHSSKI